MLARWGIHLILACCMLAAVLAAGAGFSSWDVPAQVIAEFPTCPTAPRQLEVCEVCDFQVPSMTLEWFDAQMATAVAQAMSEWNLDLVTRTDALLQAGAFGKSTSKDARREARRHVKYLSLNALDFVGYISTQEATLWETDEEEIGAFFSGFANPGMYPIWGMKRCLLGGGAFCMEFDIAGTRGGHRVMGGRSVKLRPASLTRQGKKLTAWDIEMPVAEHDDSCFLFCSRYSGRIRTAEIEEDGQSIFVLILEDLEGFYVKKKGTHRCEALVLWRSIIEDGSWPPAKPMIGAAAYFPSLKLDLPLFLPDVNLADLRSFSAFQPLFALTTCRGHSFPDWLEVSPEGVFEGWDSEGPIPRTLHEWFPDL